MCDCVQRDCDESMDERRELVPSAAWAESVGSVARSRDSVNKAEFKSLGVEERGVGPRAPVRRAVKITVSHSIEKR